MHRSSSTSRVSSELFSSQSQSQSYSSSSDNDQQEEQEQELLLPTYDPLSHVAKKQLSSPRSAQSAVHLIPLVLLLCAIILWFFSTPGIYIYIYSFLTHPSALLYFSIYSLSIFFFYISFDWLLGDEFWVWNDIDQLLFLFIYLYASNVSSCFISLVTVDQLLGILLSYQILLLLLLLMEL